MSQFFKYTLATILGIVLSIVFLTAMFILFVYLASRNENPEIDPNSVLKLQFDYDIPDRTKSEGFNFDPATFEAKTTLGVNDILDNIEKAKNDDHIKGIFLNVSNLTTGMALTDEIRDKLAEFKKSGKFVVAYAELMTQKAYYLASVADQIYLNPRGLALLKGYSSELTFFKGTLDQLGVEPEIFYAGNFKSATEPLRYTKMSDYNRLQIRELLNGFQEDYVQKVAEARGITPAELTAIMNDLKIQKAEDAKQHKMVDDVLYLDQVEALLREKLGLDAKEGINYVSLSKYHKAPNPAKKDFHKDKVAVLYAEGDIVDGKTGEGSIASEDYIAAIRDIADDENVKAVVLRINSGGGSALASDVILRELDVLKQKNIPIIASMGDVAASGGYYIAAHADTIVARDNTVTGSIGVFGITAELDNFYKNKLGFTFDTVKTTAHSDFPVSPLLNRDFTDVEKAVMQNGVNEIYETFLNIVAKGRNMTRDQVHEVAQGRVWRGETARQIGLVDVQGGIQDAIALAAKAAGLNENEYRTADFPKQEDRWTKLIGEITGQTRQSWIEQELGDQYVYYKQLRSLMNLKGIQMRMPFELQVD